MYQKQNYEILSKNINGNLSDFGIEKDFLKMTQKDLTVKMMDKSVQRVRNEKKYILSKMKRQVVSGKKILIIHKISKT